MSLKGIAKQTLAIVEQGYYDRDDSVRVHIGDAVADALAGTLLYRPDELAALLAPPSPARSTARCEVANETTQIAAQRLATDGGSPIALLNFASARNPGGGFENGAKAQEEDLARCSALVPCQRTQPVYYATNRAETSLLYTDHLIYSPAVPFFRVRNRSLLPAPFTASVITAPAPNAGEHLRRIPGDETAVREALVRRAGYVLAVAKRHAIRRLVLGAWGCGVFRNDPADVADAFATWLDDAQFATAFDHVAFAVYDRTKTRANLRAFESRFAD